MHKIIKFKLYNIFYWSYITHNFHMKSHKFTNILFIYFFYLAWEYFYHMKYFLTLFFFSSGINEASYAKRLQVLISSMLMPSTSWAMRYSLFTFVSKTSGSSELIVTFTPGSNNFFSGCSSMVRTELVR